MSEYGVTDNVDENCAVLTHHVQLKGILKARNLKDWCFSHVTFKIT